MKTDLRGHDTDPAEQWLTGAGLGGWQGGVRKGPEETLQLEMWSFAYGDDDGSMGYTHTTTSQSAHCEWCTVL